MIEKWKAERGWAHIKRVECTRETKVSVWFMTRKFRLYTPDEIVEVKAAKETDMVKYHDTWAEAKAWLVMIADSEVKQARRALEMANSHYGNVKGLRSNAEVSGPSTRPPGYRAGTNTGEK